ncbi:hypothetical protein BDN70DRAFT_819312 [Pholiota conissans]|uniref:DUF7137 domain-containing protein n=1 Tax=Pholiota conissans TaxID=109636 RepID=A0A9P5YLG0_9AGAR|nr:hypothetical protein BDN70DRAFT_819312 [Pholiota conissans]
MSQTPAGSSSSFSPIPQTAAAGGITITKPPQTATSFFKVAPGETITFAWNFTSILATPTSLTVSAVCANGNTYPVGPTDGHIPGTATEVLWDVGSYQQNNPQNPLPMASCTLHVWDDRGPGASIKPGFMQENSGLQFALYTPQAYTPLASGWTCAACSDGVMGFTAHPAFVSLIVTIFIAVFSGFHLLRNASK